MKGYDFHPEAVVDLDEIWDFIAHSSTDAADRLIAEILTAVDKLASFPKQGHNARISPPALCGSPWYANT